MPSAILLVAVSFLAPGADGAKPAGPDTISWPLLAVARTINLDPRSRLAAIDSLGKLGPRAAGAVDGLADILKNPLVDPTAAGAGTEDVKLLLMQHAAQALGLIGPAAIKALPELALAKGKNPAVDKAVDEAVEAILALPKPAPPKPPAVPLKTTPKVLDVKISFGVMHLQISVRNQE